MVIGASGHNVQGQIDLINKVLGPVIADGTVAGLGLCEVSLSRGAESNIDHAAKWETSNMMSFYPKLVDLLALWDGPLAPAGIGGMEPGKHASIEVGWRNVPLASRAMGKKARELLDALPVRASQPSVITPGYWRML